LDIKLLAPGEWQVLKTVRLRALLDSPCAFTSDYAAEARWGARDWRERLAAGTWAVAIDSGAIIGIAGLANGQSGAIRHVESIWVSRQYRRRQVFRSLINTLADVARGVHLRELLLWVLEDNASAIAAYAHVGFRWTGERQPIDPNHVRWEQRWRLVLGPAA
jgi:GNAT superfamily N-acetyltransferase